MGERKVLLERCGRAAILTLNRPERLNTFNLSVFEALDSVLDDIEADLPRALVITGAGDRAFSAGFDVNPDNPMVADLMRGLQNKDREPALKLLERCRRTVDRLVDLPIPVIAAINGLAYGGGAEVSSRCDLRVMDPDAVLTFSEVRLGLMPDWGGGPALARMVGRARAIDLFLTAREVGAEEALSMGLANRISEPGKVLECALSVAEEIAANGPRAVRAALKILRTTLDHSFDAALEAEINEAADLIASGECIHGITALMSKTKPDFPDPD